MSESWLKRAFLVAICFAGFGSPWALARDAGPPDASVSPKPSASSEDAELLKELELLESLDEVSDLELLEDLGRDD